MAVGEDDERMEGPPEPVVQGATKRFYSREPFQATRPPRLRCKLKRSTCRLISVTLALFSIMISRRRCGNERGRTL